jgi:signal transduction histidine kinase
VRSFGVVLGRLADDRTAGERTTAGSGDTGRAPGHGGTTGAAGAAAARDADDDPLDGSTGCSLADDAPAAGRSADDPHGDSPIGDDAPTACPIGDDPSAGRPIATRRVARREPAMSPITRAVLQTRAGDPAWIATGLAGSAQIAGLAIGLADPGGRVLAASVAIAGVVIAALMLLPLAARVVRGQAGPTIVGLVAMLVIALWAVRRVGFAGHDGQGPRALIALPGLPGVGALRSAAGFGFGRGTLVPLALMTLAATGGLVLLADSLRARHGAGQSSDDGPWRRITGISGRPGRLPWRAAGGVLLIAWAAFLGLGLAGRYAADDRALQILLLVLVAGGAAIVIGTPLLIASLTRIDRHQADQAREDERQRFAAHLHDSVLQTLALVQRQANDPVAVARLARRQEHALRAWMAGEAELSGETLSAALRAVVAGVEDEQDVTVEISVIGDRRLDGAGEALVAAAREALRNAARHAGGAAVFVFAELSTDRAEVFVRDEGRGFELEHVPTERRGIRDAIIGRMAAVGGRACVESVPGEGTEVALRIGGLR